MSAEIWIHWKTKDHPALAKIYKFEGEPYKGAVGENQMRDYNSLEAALSALCGQEPRLSTDINDWDLKTPTPRGGSGGNT